MLLTNVIADSAGQAIVQLVVAMFYIFPLKKWGILNSYYRMRFFSIFILVDLFGNISYGESTWSSINMSAGNILFAIGIILLVIIYPVSCWFNHGKGISINNDRDKSTDNESKFIHCDSNENPYQHSANKIAPYIRNIINNIWPIIFMISVLVMINNPPYHQTKNNVETFVGYGTFSAPPSIQYKQAHIDTTRLGMQIIVSAAVCGIGYKIMKK